MKFHARRMLKIGALLLLPFMGACAFERDYIEVRHTPPSAVTAVPNANSVGIQVTARDGRTSNRDRVSVKKNGYGMELAAIIASNDVIDETRRGVEAVFGAQGFRTSGGEGSVDIEVLRFYSDFKLGFFSGSAEAEISVNVRVTRPGGELAYTQTYTVQGLNQPLMVMTGSNARIALENGLNALLATIAADGGLSRAVLALAPPPQPRPARRPTV